MACALDEFVSRTSEKRIPLWIDAWDYGRQLIGRGDLPPWGDIGAFVAYHRQLQSLCLGNVPGGDQHHLHAMAGETPSQLHVPDADSGHPSPHRFRG